MCTYPLISRFNPSSFSTKLEPTARVGAGEKGIRPGDIQALFRLADYGATILLRQFRGSSSIYSIHTPILTKDGVITVIAIR